MRAVEPVEGVDAHQLEDVPALPLRLVRVQVGRGPDVGALLDGVRQAAREGEDVGEAEVDALPGHGVDPVGRVADEDGPGGDVVCRVGDGDGERAALGRAGDAPRDHRHAPRRIFGTEQNLGTRFTQMSTPVLSTNRHFNRNASFVLIRTSYFINNLILGKEPDCYQKIDHVNGSGFAKN